MDKTHLVPLVVGSRTSAYISFRPFLVATIVFAALSLVLASVSAQGTLHGAYPAATSTLPSGNSIPDFRAIGTDQNGNSIKIDSSGGEFTYRGQVIHLNPWHARYWGSIAKPYWLFYLASVTTTDFYIAYLYLDNVPSDPFGLYLLHYADGQYSWLGGFVGQQSVGSTTVLSPTIEALSLSIEGGAKFPNRLFASGASLQMLGNEGRFENMQIYSLLNLYNVTRSSNDWNELWVLETDGINYYYAIFYAFNNDHSSLRYAYELKLNDLSTRYTETYLTVSANWYLGTPTPIPEFSAPPRYTGHAVHSPQLHKTRSCLVGRVA